MKKFTVALLAIAALIVFSCKKKEKDPEPVPTPTTPSNNYDGLLSCTEMASVFSGTIGFTSGYSQAIFPTGGFYNSSSISDGFMGTAVNAGTVSVNSIVMKPGSSTSGILYEDSTNTVHGSPMAWSVSGANGIPAFTYTYTGVRPTYTGWNTLQDTIKLNQTTTINFTGVSGADEIYIYVMSGTAYVSKVLSGTASGVTFSTSELSTLAPSSSSTIWITVSKSSIAGINGKNFKFKTSYGIFKSIVTK